METQSSPAPSSVDIEAWRVLVLHGPEPSAIGVSSVLTAGGSLRLQRGEGGPGALGLPDPEVSQAHAHIVFEGDAGWLLRDLQSRNGTFVGGARVDERRLEHGDVIRVGRHLLLWQHLDKAACERLVRGQHDAASPLIGRSHELLRVREEIAKAAASGLPALILGESGSGKELVAQAIHEAAGGGPFVAVNCAALPENLAESELFGHARGAFTGATAQSAGLFGQAEGGTLFLDEIGELSPPLQSKLLRVLATREVRGVGQQQARRVEVRVVAATNRELEAAVRDGGFRGDLYARFLGAHVYVPRLSARREDILELASHFLGNRGIAISTDAAEALLVHAWPWNVRELEHLIVSVADEARARAGLSLDLLPAPLQQPFEPRRSTQPPAPRWDALLGVRREAAPTRDELQRVLEHFKGNVSRVAAFFGRERRQVYRWAEHHQIEIVDARGSNHSARE